MSGDKSGSGEQSSQVTRVSPPLPSTSQWVIAREAALTVLRRHRHPEVRAQQEDIAQEVVLEFATAAATEVIVSPEAWGRLVARRRAIDLMRRLRDGGDPEGDDAQALRQFLLSGLVSSRQGMLAQQADLLLGALTERQRDLIRLVADDMSHADIATELGYANAQSVKATLHRIRRQIMASAAELGIDSDWADHPAPYGDARQRDHGHGPDL